MGHPTLRHAYTIEAMSDQEKGNRTQVQWIRTEAAESPYKKQPAFDFVAVDERIAAARGAGGGVALWLRTLDGAAELCLC